MKSPFYLAVSICLLISIASCSKDSGIKLQAHDNNRMMDSVHVMMSRMDTTKMTNDPDIDFAAMMRMHHQGAISMANLEIQQGKNDSLKRIAQKTIEEQQKEIQDLSRILAGLSVDNSDPEFTMEQKANMGKMDTTADIQLITGDIDNDFATLMIVHHQSATDNASAYLHHGHYPDLLDMAKSMVKSQTMEINELASWLIANKRKP
ncbi:MAG TPA: DUF305 domain-containing protein [Puia sp.]|uniref:DUF305 domain-containing protein n=1 Tax=Puia sp. TaxID=2045100 RepID=UPI00092829B6|nr:DUF305 domain-containing protein [Puia sp.]MBN8852703.1 DUF305 domain-containing protein [Sphingobacteriales bacterium]OJW55526.1 MAG: hypothetical protein BGO55_03005 [Sphingobacteriales bacterium 50-39]HVU96829.1 DUF305 domain-containing protein [Puia sp.]